MTQSRPADDGLTFTDARRAGRAASAKQEGAVISIDRDAPEPGDSDPGDRVETFSVTVLSRSGDARKVTLNRRFTVDHTTRDEPPKGLTYRDAVRARRAATGETPGAVVEIDTEDEGQGRYEVDVLGSNDRERTVRLSESFDVVGGPPADD